MPLSAFRSAKRSARAIRALVRIRTSHSASVSVAVAVAAAAAAAGIIRTFMWKPLSFFGEIIGRRRPRQFSQSASKILLPNHRLNWG